MSSIIEQLKSELCEELQSALAAEKRAHSGMRESRDTWKARFDIAERDISTGQRLMKERDSTISDLRAKLESAEAEREAKLLVFDQVDQELAEARRGLTSERQRREEAEKERDAYKKAKEENDERFIRERDEARAKCEELDAYIASLTATNDELSRKLNEEHAAHQRLYALLRAASGDGLRAAVGRLHRQYIASAAAGNHTRAMYVRDELGAILATHPPSAPAKAETADGLREELTRLRREWNNGTGNEHVSDRRAVYAVWRALDAHPAPSVDALDYKALYGRALLAESSLQARIDKAAGMLRSARDLVGPFASDVAVALTGEGILSGESASPTVATGETKREETGTTNVRVAVAVNQHGQLLYVGNACDSRTLAEVEASTVRDLFLPEELPVRFSFITANVPTPDTGTLTPAESGGGE